MFFEQLPQQLVNGIILGSIYALLALGYTMVYGIIKLINFAHGDIYMMGAFVGYYAINSLKMNFWIALVFARISVPETLIDSNPSASIFNVYSEYG